MGETGKKEEISAVAKTAMSEEALKAYLITITASENEAVRNWRKRAMKWLEKKQKFYETEQTNK